MPAQPGPRALAFRRHAAATDPGGYWVAEADGQVAGFAIAVRRPGLWYLAALHVLPQHQGRGVGRRLLDLALATRQPGDAACVIADAVQPVSGALYVRAGMLPWAPIFRWEGVLRAAPAASACRPAAGPQEPAAIDRAVLGTSREYDHRFWQEQQGLTCLTLPGGYAYVSDQGDVGPVAATEEGLMQPLLAGAARWLVERRVSRIALKVPGAAAAASAFAAVRGMRIAGSALVLLSSRPLWTAGCYLISAGDALL